MLQQCCNNVATMLHEMLQMLQMLHDVLQQCCMKCCKCCKCCMDVATFSACLTVLELRLVGKFAVFLVIFQNPNDRILRPFGKLAENRYGDLL